MSGFNVWLAISLKRKTVTSRSLELLVAQLIVLHRMHESRTVAQACKFCDPEGRALLFFHSLFVKKKWNEASTRGRTKLRLKLDPQEHLVK